MSYVNTGIPGSKIGRRGVYTHFSKEMLQLEKFPDYTSASVLLARVQLMGPPGFWRKLGSVDF